MQKITVASTKSTVGVSLLDERCRQCNGVNGHHGTCPTLGFAPDMLRFIEGLAKPDWKYEGNMSLIFDEARALLKRMGVVSAL